MKKQKNFLIINMAYVGDVLITSGLCQEIKNNYPDSKLLMITTPASHQIAKNIPAVDEAYVFDKRGKDKGLLGMLKFVFNFKYRGKIDAAFIVHSYFRGVFLAFFLGCKRRIADYWLNKSSAFLLTDLLYKKPGERNPLNKVDNYANYISVLTSTELKEDISYNCPQSAIEKARQMIVDEGYGDFKLIGLSTNSKLDIKDWNAVESAKFIEMVNKTGKKVVLTGTENAQALAENIRKLGTTDFLDLTCKTDLEELAGVIHHCEAVVSVDTGSMHLSIALKKPTVCLFFMDLHEQWGPKRLERSTVIYDPKAISAEETFEKLEKLLLSVKQTF